MASLTATPTRAGELASLLGGKRKCGRECPWATMRQYRWRVPAEPDVEFRRPLIVNNEHSSTETPAKSRTDSTICPTGVPAREPVLASD